jgi:hypothetical protein
MIVHVAGPMDAHDNETESSQKFLGLQRFGPQEKTRENIILLYKRLRTPSEACPQRMLLRNKSKGTILPRMQFMS